MNKRGGSKRANTGSGLVGMSSAWANTWEWAKGQNSKSSKRKLTPEELERVKRDKSPRWRKY